ncbi:MAG: GH25 family lysozyme, partial [Alphaproteobacteria bacterium]|nr:GH25 family lysozyme [Alphaproteobacteria bacterium]
MNFYAIGIDVSHWEGTPDFKKVKAAGRNFVIVKLTNGLTVDAQAANNIKNAKAAGLDVGVYHFSTALNVTQAREQAAFFIKTVKQFLPLSYP